MSAATRRGIRLKTPDAPASDQPQASAQPEPYSKRVAESHEIPPALRDLPYWVAWRLMTKKGKTKPDKVPVSPRTGKSNWGIGASFCTDFETASDYATKKGLWGVGFLLVEGCGVSGIDLDHCRDPKTGELSDLAQGIIDETDTYFEVSPGLSGVRGFVLGSFGGHTGNDHAQGIEFYEPTGGRFLTVTGDHIESSPFAIETRDLTDLGARYFTKQAKQAAHPPERDQGTDTASDDLNDLGLSAFTKRVIRSGDVSAYKGDRSAALFGLAKDLVKAGLTDEAAARVLCNPDHGISEKALSERGGDWASAMDWLTKYTLKKARSAVESGPVPPPAAESTALPSAPDGWLLTKNMVFEVRGDGDDEEQIPTAGPIWITGRTTGHHGEWGLVLVFVDHDGTRRKLAIPAARLHEDANALSRELATLGLRTFPGRERKLLSYLAAWQVDTRILSAKRLGWLEDATGELAFVMPDAVIAKGHRREVVFQPERFSPTTKTVHEGGDLDQWKSTVAAPACRHQSMLFALCAGLAPAFQAFGEAGDSFIVHFWGTTSRGKTALAQIAASPWGCAADPADAPSLTFVRRWNVTGNGLEGLAEAHSDLPLVLDELGSSTVADIRPLVYQLSGGQGKAAMTSTREMREPRSWRTIAISTGEISIRARMADPKEDGKIKAVKGGLVHRALDIELSDIAIETPAKERGDLVSGIKVACARHYGTAGPELVRMVAERFQGHQDARAYVRDQVADIFAAIAPPDLAAETARAVRRFCLIATAGIFAADQGLIPTTKEDIISATKVIVDSWRSASSDTDEQRIVASVRDFILKHEARFQPTDVVTEEWGETAGTRKMMDPVRDRVGFVDHARDRWLFTDQGLSEAAPGHDKITIARSLKAAGHLETMEGKLQIKVSLSGSQSRPRMYSVKGNILDGAEPEKTPHHSKTGGQGGHSGQAQQPQGLEPVHLAETQGGQGGHGGDAVHPVHLSTDHGGQPVGRATAENVHPVHPVHLKNRDGALSPEQVATAYLDKIGETDPDDRAAIIASAADPAVLASMKAELGGVV